LLVLEERGEEEGEERRSEEAERLCF